MSPPFQEVTEQSYFLRLGTTGPSQPTSQCRTHHRVEPNDWILRSYATSPQNTPENNQPTAGRPTPRVRARRAAAPGAAQESAGFGAGDERSLEADADLREEGARIEWSRWGSASASRVWCGWRLKGDEGVSARQAVRGVHRYKLYVIIA